MKATLLPQENKAISSHIWSQGYRTLVAFHVAVSLPQILKELH